MKWKSSLFQWAAEEPTATVAFWAKAQQAGPLRRPSASPRCTGRGQCMASAHAPCARRAVTAAKRRVLRCGGGVLVTRSSPQPSPWL
jgi:hypothetical protein